MNVNDILDINTIRTDLECQNKSKALESLTNVLFEAGYINDQAVFLKDIYAREEIGQTGIGNFIAIPHGMSEAVDKVGVAIGVLKDAIEWETLDGNGVKIIILFSVGKSNDGANEHLRLLSTFARKLGNDDVVEALKNANNAEAVIKAFN